MINLLAEATTNTNVADWVSIGVSGFLSLALIVVTIITSISNCKVQKKIAQANEESAKIGKDTARIGKEAALLPLKLEIIDSLLSFDKRYYDTCTQLFLLDSIDDDTLNWVGQEIDELITQIYADGIKIRTVSSEQSVFYKVVDKIYKETMELYRLFGQCKNHMATDLDKGHKKLKTEARLRVCKDLVQDVFKDNVNFDLYTFEMDRKTIDFIKQYIVIYDDLDALDYKDLIEENL